MFIFAALSLKDMIQEPNIRVCFSIQELHNLLEKTGFYKGLEFRLLQNKGQRFENLYYLQDLIGQISYIINNIYLSELIKSISDEWYKFISFMIMYNKKRAELRLYQVLIEMYLIIIDEADDILELQIEIEILDLKNKILSLRNNLKLLAINYDHYRPIPYLIDLEIIINEDEFKKYINRLNPMQYNIHSMVSLSYKLNIFNIIPILQLPFSYIINNIINKQEQKIQENLYRFYTNISFITNIHQNKEALNKKLSLHQKKIDYDKQDTLSRYYIIKNCAMFVINYINKIYDKYYYKLISQSVSIANYIYNILYIKYHLFML